MDVRGGRPLDTDEGPFDFAAAPLCVTDDGGSIVRTNPAFEEAFGSDAATHEGAALVDLAVPEDRPLTRAALERLGGGAGGSVRFSNRCRVRDGGERRFEWTCGTADADGGRIYAFARDLSAGDAADERLRRLRGQLETQLQQTQRMETVGQLVGGVAHDFNNLLTAILGYSEMAIDQIADDAPLRADIEEIHQAGQRAQALTRQLLSFSRRETERPRVLDVNRVVESLDRLLRRVLGERIGLRLDLAPDLDPVKCDPGRIDQIVMNLAVNARDAMPGGGRITLQTRNVVLSEEHVRRHPDAQPGPHVLIAVSDTGLGMDAETRQRIFEPFFTTKERGQGTGLGLATVHDIVTQGGGSIAVTSEPALGSTFRVYLPAADEALGPSDLVVTEPRAVQRSETVLVVEDEGAVRRLIERALRDAGYVVLSTGDADTASHLCTSHEGPIDLLLTDVVLPRRSGRDLAASLVALRPDLRVLYMSGYADDSAALERLDPEAAFIEKPLTPSRLLLRLREILA